MAKGCVRHWGCTCSAYPVLRPYHAAVRQWDLVHASFPEAVGPNFPVFPTVDGEFFDPDASIAMVLELARRTGKHIRSAAGLLLFGRHTWRSTAAWYFAYLGMELFKIQLLARWESSVIMHYARLAPIKGVAQHTVTLKTQTRLPDIIKELQASVVEMRAKLDAMESQTRARLEEELAIDVAEHDPSVDMVSLPYLLNLDTNSHHRIVTAMESLPASWKTKCGWRFHEAAFRFIPRVLSSKADDICKRCFPAEHLKAKLDGKR